VLLAGSRRRVLSRAATTFGATLRCAGWTRSLGDRIGEVREEVTRVHAALPGEGRFPYRNWPDAQTCGPSSPRRPSLSSWRTAP
jgi:hypothetical protein